MKLSKKTDYALRALFSLVERWGDGPVSMTQLARENDVPKRFLEHIMLDLKEQGWVASSPGAKRGLRSCPVARAYHHGTGGAPFRRSDGPDRLRIGDEERALHAGPPLPISPGAAGDPQRHRPAHGQFDSGRGRRAEPVGDDEVFALALVEGDGI